MPAFPERTCLFSGVAVFLIIVAAGGCRVGPTRVERGVEGGILYVGNGAEPADLDPHVVTGVVEHHLLSSMFEGLCDLDPKELKPIPAAAESWDISPDRTVYTFTIRDGARWSNGDPLTAHDFVYSYRRILSPALASEYAYLLHCIRGARAFNEGETSDFGTVGVEALDDRTLRVTLENPTPYFLSMQIHYAWYPVHRETIERYGAMDERGTRWTRPGNHVSNGPFMLARWEPDRVVSVVPNPHYWDAATVRLNEIQFYPVDNDLTEELLFRVGRLHLTEQVPVHKIDVYQAEHPELLRIDPYLGTYFYRLNTTRPPFDDPRVRQAFSMALDRDDLVRNVVRAGRKPAYNLTPPNTAGYTCDAQAPYDPEAARQLLAEAGYPNGQGLPPVEILYNTSENHKLIAEAVQAMWRENLGVHVTLLNQEWKVYLDSMSNLDYQVVRSAWVGDVLDPVNFIECFTSGNGNNRTGWSSEKYDALVAASRSAATEDERYALLRQAEALLVEAAPIVPVYFYTRVYLRHPAVQGAPANLLGYYPWKRMYLGYEEDAP